MITVNTLYAYDIYHTRRDAFVKNPLSLLYLMVSSLKIALLGVAICKNCDLIKL
jgi:hypothetical protein